ncbi:MAG TPA: LysE family translocator [Oligoflexia bacterium]|nr:LysE family translocator [Oligoflexia bacterium]HMR24576.1 LysE family translocator [Oligoflexia bacterium]
MFKELAPIFLIHLLGLFSPGPDFAVVLKNSFESQKKALFTALGIACGLMGHVTVSVLGLGVLLQQSFWLSQTIQAIGALYLGYLGVKIFLKSKPKNKTTINEITNSETQKKTSVGGFKEGFWVNVLNPKAGMFIMSLFAQMANSGKVLQLQLILAAFILISSWLWFSTVALFLNISYIRVIFLKNVPAIEKLMAFMLVVFAFLILRQIITVA